MLDWDHLQSFLAVARHGNLSAAARSLKITQTTMGRRLEALHAQAGVRLLQKTPAGFVLTQAGEKVLASVERIEVEALSVERAITGEDERIAGEVRVTTVDSFGARIIIPMLHPHPQRPARDGERDGYAGAKGETGEQEQCDHADRKGLRQPCPKPEGGTWGTSALTFECWHSSRGPPRPTRSKDQAMVPTAYARVRRSNLRSR